jgi:origin recognition complex subunit 3
MDDEKCFVYKAAESKSDKRKRNADQSNVVKRRKIEPETGLDASRPMREEIYRDFWNYQRDSIQSVLDEANNITLNEIFEFLDEERPDFGTGAIPAGFVLAGPDTTSHSTFFEQLSRRINDTSSQVLVTLNSAESPNIKSLLKALVNKIVDQDDEWISEHYGTRLLEYDLQMVYAWLQNKAKNVVVIGIENSEAFLSAVLTDLIDYLRYDLLSRIASIFN